MNHVPLTELLDSYHLSEPERGKVTERFRAEVAEATKGLTGAELALTRERYAAFIEILGFIDHFDHHRRNGTMAADCGTLSMTASTVLELAGRVDMMTAIYGAKSGMDPEAIANDVEKAMNDGE